MMDLNSEQTDAQPSASYVKQRDDCVSAMINGAYLEIKESRQIARTALSKAYDAGYNHGYLNGFDHPKDAAEAEQRRLAAEARQNDPCALCGSQRYRHGHSTRAAGHPFMEA